MSTTLPGAASTTHLDRNGAAKAFELWENEFRATPEDFYTPEEAAAMEVATLSEGRAIAFFAYLRQARQTIIPPAVGQYWPEQSAWYAGPVAYPDGRVIALLLPDGQESLGKMPWGEYGQQVPGATSHHDGRSNTAAMAAAGSAAAQAVLALGEDWYIPSQIEALQLYATLKQRMGPGWTWTSTQHSAISAFVQDFEYGYSDWYYEGNDYRVRAVRGLALHHFSTSTEGGAS